MKSFFDKLNLRPGERRLVVIVGIVVFIVLNVWFVFPNFGKAAVLDQKIKDAEKNLIKFQNEVKHKKEYETELRKLQLSGQFVAQEDQALQLQREIVSQAALAGVTVLRYDSTPRMGSGHTNAFFDESTLVITVSTGEKELLDFLYNLSSRNSLIRVRSMTLGPEPTRMRLSGSLTLVESFQRKPVKAAAPAAAAAPPPKPTAPAAKPPPPKPPEKKTNAPAATTKPASTTKTTNVTKKPVTGK